MKESDVRKLVDMLWQCICTPWYAEFRDRFAAMEIDELAKWVRQQINHSFPVQEAGSSYISLLPDNFDESEPETPVKTKTMLREFKAERTDEIWKIKEVLEWIDSHGHELVSMTIKPYYDPTLAHYYFIVRTSA